MQGEQQRAGEAAVREVGCKTGADLFLNTVTHQMQLGSLGSSSRRGEVWGLRKKDPNLVPSSYAEDICSPIRMLLARPGLKDGQRAGHGIAEIVYPRVVCW